MEIRKKIWPEIFEKVKSGKRNIDMRLADFEIKEGDVLILEEYNPKTKSYTGRTIRRIVRNVNKTNPFSFYTTEEIKKFGLWSIELGK